MDTEAFNFSHSGEPKDISAWPFVSSAMGGGLRMENSPVKGGHWVYVEQDGSNPYAGDFYERFKIERGRDDNSDFDAARFGMYLLEHIEEVENYWL